ncbi:MAG TPA: MMPL family transporter [Miltoncostaeaceae bacterium]|nr:MMPL family transporter [Miltoncostaeaceae bacterium]
MEAQGAALQQQAAALTQQQAQLEALQATAKKQQQQALALKNSLTVTLTKAGGDDRGTDPRLVKLQDALGDTAGVNVVSPPQINATGNAATFTAIAATAPADPATADLVARVRDRVVPKATAGTDMTVSVGGSTAANVDLAAEISSRLPLVILVVLGLSVIVLILAFRSLLVPLQAAVVNLICVGSAFGVITAAFQWGWGINLFAIDTPSSTVPIASFVPLMMFAGLFGLSMDYQVFLLSQIAQSREKSDGERAAIADGITHSAPVITAAALIMIGVFGSFVLNGDPTVKQFGVGLSVALVLAGISVLALVPALLSLLGGAGWYLPAFLQRALPDMDIEGASISERAAHATHEATTRAAADDGREPADPGDDPEPSVPAPVRARPAENAPRPVGDPAPAPSADGGAPSAHRPSPPEKPSPGTPRPPEGGMNGGRPPSAPPPGDGGESSPAPADRRADSAPPSH